MDYSLSVYFMGIRGRDLRENVPNASLKSDLPENRGIKNNCSEGNDIILSKKRTKYSFIDSNRYQF